MDLMAARRALLYKRNSLLPVGYKQVEYIYNDGNAWIDTGIIPNTNTVSRIKFMNLQYTGDVIYGYYEGDDNKDYRIFNPSATTYFDCIGSRINGRGSAMITVNQVYELEIGNYYLKNLHTDEVVLNGTPQTFTGYSTVTLNYYNSSGASKVSKNRWYYVKIFDNSTIVRDMIPCIRLSDNIAGMYDLVTKSFFGSLSQDAFLTGNPV